MSTDKYFVTGAYHGAGRFAIRKKPNKISGNKDDEMNGNCMCPMISAGNALNEDRIVAKEEHHNSHMLVLACIYIHILFLLLALYFKKCSNMLSEEKDN